MKRLEHTVHSDRHVSPHVLSADCCREYTNAAAILPNWSVASCGGEHRKIIPRTSFTEKNLGKEIKKWSILTFFLATVTWPPPPAPLCECSWDSLRLAGVILGGSPCKLTWQVDLTSCHLSTDLNRGRRRGWQVNLTSATCQVDLSSWLKLHLCSTKE